MHDEATKVDRPRLSIETQVLERRLADCATPGELIGYDELTQLLGREVRETRWALDAARRRVQAEHNKIFVTITNKGLRLATEEEKLDVATNRLAHCGRQTRKAGRELASTRFEDLAPASQRRYNLTATRTVLATTVLSLATEKRLAVCVEKRMDRLEAAESMRLLTGLDSL